MPVVPADQVKTEEKAWQGVHLLYFDGSLCVRKVQLVLALKGIDYTKKRVSMQDLHTEWYTWDQPTWPRACACPRRCCHYREQ